jgi:hypothetical protein
MCFEIYDELSSLAKDTFYLYFTSHLFNNIFAYGESKTSALAVSLRVLIQLAEINKELLESFLGNSYPSVNDTDLELNEPLFSIFDRIRCLSTYIQI